MAQRSTRSPAEAVAALPPATAQREDLPALPVPLDVAPPPPLKQPPPLWVGLDDDGSDGEDVVTPALDEDTSWFEGDDNDGSDQSEAPPSYGAEELATLEDEIMSRTELPSESQLLRRWKEMERFAAHGDDGSMAWRKQTSFRALAEVRFDDTQSHSTSSKQSEDEQRSKDERQEDSSASSPQITPPSSPRAADTDGCKPTLNGNTPLGPASEARVRRVRSENLVGGRRRTASVCEKPANLQRRMTTADLMSAFEPPAVPSTPPPSHMRRRRASLGATSGLAVRKQLQSLPLDRIPATTSSPPASPKSGKDVRREAKLNKKFEKERKKQEKRTEKLRKKAIKQQRKTSVGIGGIIPDIPVIHERTSTGGDSVRFALPLSRSSPTLETAKRDDVILNDVARHMGVTAPEKYSFQPDQELRSRADLFEADDDGVLSVVRREGDAGELLTTVTGATKEKLVQRITSHTELVDAEFLDTFLLTYRSYFSATELMKLLLLRFDNPAPENSANWDTVLKIIRLRVVNVLKTWVERHASDFADDTEALDLLLQIAGRRLVTCGMAAASTQLMKLIERYVAKQANVSSVLTPRGDKPPKPAWPSKRSSPLPSLRDVPPLEIARQLTLIEHELYSRITPKELLKQAWMKEDKATRAPNIVAVIRHFNYISHFVSTAIVREGSPKPRALMLNRMILLAKELRALNNYNGVMEVLSGLQSTGVYRLINSWNLLPAATWDIFDRLQEEMSHEDNWQHYRDALKNTSGPAVPYVGLCLTDLTFVDEGNRDTVTNHDTMINWTKARYTATLIQGVLQFQTTLYRLQPVDLLRKFLLGASVLDEQQVYKRSLELEPRERRAS